MVFGFPFSNNTSVSLIQQAVDEADSCSARDLESVLFPDPSMPRTAIINAGGRSGALRCFPLEWVCASCWIESLSNSVALVVLPVNNCGRPTAT